MIRIVRAAAVSAVVAGAAFLTISGSAFADGKTTVQSLKDKGYSCEHTATNMTTCTKSGEKDQTCSENEDTCVVLLVKNPARRIQPINVGRALIG
ncbi:MAG TPA: hypothetical protein VGE11_17385 [Pseudonocardia sp.]